jgi:hypothetical protein
MFTDLFALGAVVAVTGLLLGLGAAIAAFVKKPLIKKVAVITAVNFLVEDM